MSTMLSHAEQAPGGRVVRSSLVIAARSMRTIVRLPSTFFPALLMPIFQAIAFSGTYYAITRIPGFPTDRSMNWFLPLACCMGSAFSGISQGFATIRDLESGFYDRLRMAPAPRVALLLGPLLAVWARALILLTVVLGVGFGFGARLHGGAIGLVTVAVAGLGLATAGAGWSLGLAFRFGDMRAAALMQLTLFIALFLTNAQMPLDVMSGWLHGAARVNPFTNVLRLARQGFLGGVTWHDSWGGLVALAAVCLATLVWARRGLARLDR